ncbi:hypothetical protein [Rhodococcus sp. WS3]|uniref:hypothetical protein n=1 Tax=Rhodococcus sp. WS3 TaxID=2486271 RepID=UPI001C9DD7D6|nr:hypothetical protein [Rhodococcus sp. WS3]
MLQAAQQKDFSISAKVFLSKDNKRRQSDLNQLLNAQRRTNCPREERDFEAIITSADNQPADSSGGPAEASSSASRASMIAPCITPSSFSLESSTPNKTIIRNHLGHSDLALRNAYRPPKVLQRQSVCHRVGNLGALIGQIFQIGYGINSL